LHETFTFTLVFLHYRIISKIDTEAEVPDSFTPSPAALASASAKLSKPENLKESIDTTGMRFLSTSHSYLQALRYQNRERILTRLHLLCVPTPFAVLSYFASHLPFFAVAPFVGNVNVLRIYKRDTIVLFSLAVGNLF